MQEEFMNQYWFLLYMSVTTLSGAEYASVMSIC